MRLLGLGGSQKGFTLVELMQVIAITAIIAISFFAVFSVMNTGMSRSKTHFDINTSAKNIIGRIANDAQEAIAVVPSYAGNVSGNTCLILKLPSIDANGIPLDITSLFDYVTYTIDGSDASILLRILAVNNGSSRNGGNNIAGAVAGKQVNAILFSGDGANLGTIAANDLPWVKNIHIQVTTQGNAHGIIQSSTVGSDFMLRNNTL